MAQFEVKSYSEMWTSLAAGREFVKEKTNKEVI
jgi:hypothetical protein